MSRETETAIDSETETETEAGGGGGLSILTGARSRQGYPHFVRRCAPLTRPPLRLGGRKRHRIGRVAYFFFPLPEVSYAFHRYGLGC